MYHLCTCSQCPCISDHYSIAKMVCYKTDNSFTELFTNLPVATLVDCINYIIYITLIATLHISPTTISSGTILRLCKFQDCVKHIYVSDQKNAFRACILQFKEFSLCECLEAQHLNKHYQKRTQAHCCSWGPLPRSVYLGRLLIALIIHMIKWTRPPLSVSAYLKTGWWEALKTGLLK